jgi:hypothetical protein
VLWLFLKFSVGKSKREGRNLKKKGGEERKESQIVGTGQWPNTVSFCSLENKILSQALQGLS